MDKKSTRDEIIVEDEQGNEKHYSVEALFDMEDQSYALLSDDDDTILMKVEEGEDEQFLISITDNNERDAILDAYQIAVRANPADDLDS